MVSYNYICLIINICLHTVIWYQVFQSNNNTFKRILGETVTKWAGQINGSDRVLHTQKALNLESFHRIHFMYPGHTVFIGVGAYLFAGNTITPTNEAWHLERSCRFFEIYVMLYQVKVSKVGDLSRGWPEGSLFNSYYTKV